MEFVNLTPHTLNVHRQDGTILTVTASGTVARVKETRQQRAVIDGIEIGTVGHGAVIGLPEPKEGCLFIVSGLVLCSPMAWRPDVASPGPLVRGADGQPTGCLGLTVH